MLRKDKLNGIDKSSEVVYITSDGVVILHDTSVVDEISNSLMSVFAEAPCKETANITD